MLIKSFFGKVACPNKTSLLYTLPLCSFSDKSQKSLSNITPSEETQSDFEKHKAFTSVYATGPDSIVARRRMQGQYTDIQKKKAEAIPKLYDGLDDIDVSFDLYLEHHQYESQLIDALLSYYKVAYTRIHSLTWLTHFRESYGKTIKDFRYPLLKAELAFEPKKYFTGSDSIVRFLCENNFIFNPSHITNSGEALQAVEFATGSLAKHLEILFYSPVLTAENMFKSAPENYRLNARSYILLKALRLHFTQLLKVIPISFYKMCTNRKEYKESKQKVLDDLKQWGDRVGNRKFHGGTEPDEADFAVYAVIKTKYNSSSFRRFLEKSCPDKAYTWFIRMQIACKYENDFIRVVI
jgi:hypothetical protein